jgi:hypothetical protein
MTEQNLQDPEGNNGNPPENVGAKTFTQADIDRVVKERLDREKSASKAKLDALTAELETYKVSATKYEESITKMIADASRDLPEPLKALFDKLSVEDKLEWLEQNAKSLPTKKSVKPVPEAQRTEPTDDVDAHLKAHNPYNI